MTHASIGSGLRMKENTRETPVGDPMADAQHQFRLERPMRVQRRQRGQPMSWSAALWKTAVTGKEAATTLHHAYSAQVHVARVLDWARAPAQAEGEAPSISSPPELDDCLAWMQRARNHAEKLCGCFPASGKVGDSAPRIAEWAEGGRRTTSKPKAGRKSIEENSNCYRGNRATAAN